MLRRVVLLVVHPHHDGDVLALGGRRDHDLLGSGRQVLLGRGALGEAAGALEHQLHPEVLPGEILGFFDGRHREGLAVHDEPVALDLHRAGETAVDGVVLEQVGQRLGVGDVVDGDELEVGLVREHGGAQHVASDPAEPVDAHSHGHEHS